jgi:hypothetical protein
MPVLAYAERDRNPKNGGTVLELAEELRRVIYRGAIHPREVIAMRMRSLYDDRLPHRRYLHCGGADAV